MVLTMAWGRNFSPHDLVLLVQRSVARNYFLLNLDLKNVWHSSMIFHGPSVIVFSQPIPHINLLLYFLTK